MSRVKSNIRNPSIICKPVSELGATVPTQTNETSSVLRRVLKKKKKIPKGSFFLKSNPSKAGKNKKNTEVETVFPRCDKIFPLIY